MAANPVPLQRFLGGIDHPASTEALVQRARDNGAGRAVIDTLDRDESTSPNDVSEAVGEQ